MVESCPVNRQALIPPDSNTLPGNLNRVMATGSGISLAGDWILASSRFLGQWYLRNSGELPQPGSREEDIEGKGQGQESSRGQG